MPNKFTIYILNICIALICIIFGAFYIVKSRVENMDTLNTNKADAFCTSHIGSSSTLNESCNKLTHKNCNSTSCCVLLKDGKCVAGSKDGPTYNTDNGKTKNSSYYYQNKCYGQKCP